jgi:hypothetical protein
MRNCSAIRAILYECRTNDELDPASQEHIQGCASCRQLARLLHKLDHHTQMLLRTHQSTIPAGLVERLQPTVQPASNPSRFAIPWRLAIRFGEKRLRIHWLVAAASLSFVIGLVLGWIIKPEPQPTLQANVPEHGKPLLIAVARHVSEIAQGTLWERHRRYALLNIELQNEAIRNLTGGLDQIPQLVYWYRRVWWEGTKKLYDRLDAEERTIAQNLLRQDWESGRGKLAKIAAFTPAQQEAINFIATILNESEHSLDQKAVFQPLAQLEPTTPAERLIHTSLALIRHDDPYQQALIHNELAKTIAQSIIVMSDSAQHEQAAELGECFNLVLIQGIATNLDKAEKETPQRPEFNELRQNTLQLTQILERHLHQGNAASQKGLQRALEVSRQGRGRLLGKGPAWKKFDDWSEKGFKRPPGWEKKQ